MKQGSASRRIVSFLPSATEMAFALGLGDQVVGVTHECDFPPEACGKPVVVRPVFAVETMTQAEIDAAVAACVREGKSLYQVDEAVLARAAPDLILTQDLCAVCAPAGGEIAAAFRVLDKPPEVLWMTPKTIDGVFENLSDLGRATGCEDRAERLIADGRQRLARLRSRSALAAHRPRVFCMEWMEPVYCSGHWVPELVEIAGGIDGLGRIGADSVRITWDEVLAYAPEVMIITPCGFHLDQAEAEARRLLDFPGWADLPAVRDGCVFVVDASSYYARPGPRLVDGAELLAALIHPDLFAWTGPEAFRPMGPPGTITVRRKAG